MYVRVAGDPYRIVRLVAFFVAGVVVAVGAALIYSMRAPTIAGPAPKENLAKAHAGPEVVAASRLPETVDLDESGVPGMAFENGDKTVISVPQTPQNREGLGRDGAIQPIRHAYVPVPPLIRPEELHLTDVERAAAAMDSSVPPPAPYSPPAAPVRQPHVATFVSGTAVSIRLGQTLSSSRDRRGETFRGTLDSPLIANGFIVADRGSTVVGRLLNVHRARLIGGASELSLVLTGINTTDGQFVAVDTYPWQDKGGRIVLGNPAKLAVGAVAEVVSDAAKMARFDGSDSSLGGLGSQKKVTLPTGTRLTFRLAVPLTITEKIASR